MAGGGVTPKVLRAELFEGLRVAAIGLFAFELRPAGDGQLRAGSDLGEGEVHRRFGACIGGNRLDGEQAQHKRGQGHEVFCTHISLLWMG